MWVSSIVPLVNSSVIWLSDVYCRLVLLCRQLLCTLQMTLFYPKVFLLGFIYFTQMYINSPRDVCLILWWPNMFNLSPTHRLLNCCQFRSSLSLQGRHHLKGTCESEDCCPCIDRCLDLKQIITVTDTCKWMVIL